MVVWLLGISGSGKTTLGNRLRQYLEELGKKVFMVDADMIRNFYNNDLGYTREDREENIKRIILAGHMLEANGIVSIIACQAPFEKLRYLARDKYDEYIEIYLKMDIEYAKINDVKNVYKDNIGKTEIAGLDLKFEEPGKSDMVLNTGEENEDVSFSRLLEYLKEHSPSNFI